MAYYEKGGINMTTNTALKIGKLVISVASVGLTFVASLNSENMMDEKIAKKVEEVLSSRK